MSASDDDSATPQALAPSQIHALVERWYVEHIHNSVVSRSVETLNHVRQAVDELKRRLELNQTIALHGDRREEI